MNLSEMDLNLLLVLHALLSERSATAAAKRLHVSQSAVSNALRRLRDALGDPLFVRSGRGLTPTPWAVELAPTLASAIAQLRAVVEGPPVFDPQTTARRFTIACTDGEAAVLLPRLLPRIAGELPRAELRIVSLDVLVAGPGLAGGDVDVIVGLAAAAAEECHRRTIYDDRLVLVARRGHPKLRRGLTLAHLSQLGWIDTLVLMGRRGVGGAMAQEIFGRHQVTRRVVLSVPSFTLAAQAAAGSDAIAGVPRRLAETLAAGLPIALHEPPFPAPPMSIALVWHPRTDADPGHRYFRELLAASLAEARGGRARRRAAPRSAG
ncbi:MAG: LysR family transcriptional regulator [Nannocystaceae bacterium]